MPRKAPMLSAAPPGWTTGTDGLKPSPLAAASRSLTHAPAPPTAVPMALSSAPFTSRLAALVALLYARCGPSLSNTQLGTEASAFCSPPEGAGPKLRLGASFHTTAAFAAASVSTFTSARSHSDRSLSPRCAASYDTAAPTVSACSSTSFTRNSGSAISLPTMARLTLVGVALLTALTTPGRHSTARKRATCSDDTSPSSIATRRAPGRSLSVLNHSCITASRLCLSKSSGSAVRVEKKPSSSPSSSQSSK
mmetsp:Transcript_902/g.2923  ORF Transcript_902/g.2923 Transcript_902/m.2923 type:complete len:251 (-) Transcript_902:465-1217(-)